MPNEIDPGPTPFECVCECVCVCVRPTPAVTAAVKTKPPLRRNKTSLHRLVTLESASVDSQKGR